VQVVVYTVSFPLTDLAPTTTAVLAPVAVTQVRHSHIQTYKYIER
jgi:hypothetical protein